MPQDTTKTLPCHYQSCTSRTSFGLWWYVTVRYTTTNVPQDTTKTLPCHYQSCTSRTSFGLWWYVTVRYTTTNVPQDTTKTLLCHYRSCTSRTSFGLWWYVNSRIHYDKCATRHHQNPPVSLSVMSGIQIRLRVLDSENVAVLSLCVWYRVTVHMMHAGIWKRVHSKDWRHGKDSTSSTSWVFYQITIL